MPKFDFSVEEKATSSTGGSPYRIEDGWYVLKVVRMENQTSKQGNPMVLLVWDVAEGPDRDKCMGNGWYENKHSVRLMLDGNAAGFTKHVIHVISDSNPGFEAGKAFVADDFKAFEGKVFGARIENGSHEYNGKTYTDTDIAEACTADEARKKAGEAPRAGANAAPAPAPAGALYDEDIPF